MNNQRIIFWGIAAFCLICLVVSFFTNSENIIINSSNVFIKYSIPIVGLYSIMVIFFIPILMERGCISVDYYNESRYVKAKSELLVIMLFLPAIIAFLIACYNKVDKPILLAIIYFYLGYRFIECLYLVWKNKKGE